MYGLGLTMTLQMVGGLRVCRRPRLGHCCRRLTLQAAITACRPVPLTQLPYTGVVDQAAKGYMYAMALFFGGLVRVWPPAAGAHQLVARCAHSAWLSAAAAAAQQPSLAAACALLQGQLVCGCLEYSRKNTFACVTWLCFSA